jgi:hypothetical protein
MDANRGELGIVATQTRAYKFAKFLFGNIRAATLRLRTQNLKA